MISATVLVVVISLMAHFEPRFPGDLEISQLFQSIHSGPLLTAMEGISYVTGDWRSAVLVVISCILVWLWMGIPETTFMTLAGLTTFISNILKIVIDRPRPTTDLVTVYVNESTKSFPSGHAFFALLVFGMLAYLVSTHLKKQNLKIMTLAISLGLILWVGASRIYLGVHWTSDVLGGYLIGGWFLLILIWLYQVIKPRFSVRSS